MDAVKEYIPPAFPNHRQTNENGEVLVYESEGLTMRDYFAAEAMHAFISRWAGHDSYDESGGGFQRVAGHAYEMADAMLEARK